MTTPESDVIIALHNILARNSSVLAPIFRSDGTANAAGDSLEYFVKDMFSPGNQAAQHSSEETKQPVYKKYLSWTGNSSNFPDFIIRGGVGVEPKKVEGTGVGNLALNSSYPKAYMTPETQNIPKFIDEEDWDSKPVVYAIGNLPKAVKGLPKSNKLSSLWLVYGNTFIADASVYQKTIDGIRGVLAELPGELMEGSKELGRLYGIDALKHTNLRVRGMYEISHPAKIFGPYIQEELKSFPLNTTSIFLVILKKDFEKLSQSVNLNDSLHELDSFFTKGRLKRKLILLTDPNNAKITNEAYIFIGYTE